MKNLASKKPNKLLYADLIRGLGELVKYSFFILVILSSVAFGETFVTDNFSIKIDNECEEGHVTCEAVKFTYATVGIEQKQIVIGKTIHSICADEVTPCAFQGYEFVADGGVYFIHSSGVLEITDKDGNQLLVEQGTWQY